MTERRGSSPNSRVNLAKSPRTGRPRKDPLKEEAKKAAVAPLIAFRKKWASHAIEQIKKMADDEALTPAVRLKALTFLHEDMNGKAIQRVETQEIAAPKIEVSIGGAKAKS